MAKPKPPKGGRPKPECPKGNGHRLKFPADISDDGMWLIHSCKKCGQSSKTPYDGNGGKK